MAYQRISSETVETQPQFGVAYENSAGFIVPLKKIQDCDGFIPFNVAATQNHA